MNQASTVIVMKKGGQVFKPSRSLFFIITLLASLWACAESRNKSETPLNVDIEPPVAYVSANGDQFVARYGSLSDGSLNFVKVKIPSGQEYTLPQAVSGSGARYTDDREIVWWEHQGTVRVDVRGVDGKWMTKYSGLKVVNGK